MLKKIYLYAIYILTHLKKRKAAQKSKLLASVSERSPYNSVSSCFTLRMTKQHCCLDQFHKATEMILLHVKFSSSLKQWVQLALDSLMNPFALSQNDLTVARIIGLTWHVAQL